MLRLTYTSTNHDFNSNRSQIESFLRGAVRIAYGVGANRANCEHHVVVERRGEIRAVLQRVNMPDDGQDQRASNDTLYCYCLLF